MNDNGVELKARYHGLAAGLAAASPEALRGVLGALYDDDMMWHGPHPLNDAVGLDAWVDSFWRPVLYACPDLERRDDIVMSGVFENRRWLAATGHYVGTFARDWLGIRATGRVLNIRFGEFARLSGSRIIESYVILDLLDVLRQAGVRKLPSGLGLEDRVPGPSTHDGILMSASEEQESASSLRLVESMIGGLMAYDGSTLASMGMERFWHPRMMWYGPCGIGTTRGLGGFESQHQEPFLRAFPDRKGGNHKARIADGDYVGSTGWPSVLATHTGDGWLGLPASGRRVGMRVMDFWRREGPWLVENWVFIDLLDLLQQMGVEILPAVRTP